MDPKLDSFDNNCSADKIAKYINRFNVPIEGQLGFALRDGLVAGINRLELQRKLLIRPYPRKDR